MTFSLPFARVSLCAVLGLVASCASSKQTREPAARPQAGQQIGDSNEPIEKTLESKFPGLNVAVAPDGSLILRIRGVSSLNGNDEPLYVLDGVPIAAAPGGALTGVNPHDIETIKVLKNPEDTAIYGMRGANGVIVITTKKPGKRP